MTLRQDTRTRSIPIIALIDQGAERDYVDLPKSGIDDIFIRPMLPAKLVDRLKALTRDPPRVPAGRARGPGGGHFAGLELALIPWPSGTASGRDRVCQYV